ncbi:glycoside hydrolase family 97 protein [Pedobacter westerhofensis]|uniref:glycoside hydrolase family 97 protein n=1 Tax=Pedobacter westerhofensis TaxID=425512 RepID=UPI001C8F224A|nr:glycoside hydrolase family 97 protein [Pedobacter westerhofensis]
MAKTKMILTFIAHMNNIRFFKVSCFVIAFFTLVGDSIIAQTKSNTETLKSPNGKLILTLDYSNLESIRYTFQADGKILINPSVLGLDSLNRIEFIQKTHRSVNTVWKPLWGKRTIVPDQFNEITIDLQTYQIVARAYNNGIAFKYVWPAGGRRSKDKTQFNFSGDYEAWFYNGERHNLGPDKLTDVDGTRLPVMTIKANDHAYMAIHEADLEEGEPLILASKKATKNFTVASKSNTAWRVVMYGRTPGELVDSHLIELLNPAPDKNIDFSWVKPGIAVWDWRINGAKVQNFEYKMSLPSWKRMVDFAAENNIRFLMLDADWYGPEFAEGSDPVKGGKVAQVHEIIAYAKNKGIGIWLYINDVGGRKYPLEQTLKQYSDWGAVGIKYGFMIGDPEEKNIRTRLITSLCAKNRLLCDFHDGPVHPYGQIRTFPNALTREYGPAQLDAHRTVAPKTFVTEVFVNMLAGPIDLNNGLADLTQAGRIDEPSPVPSTLVGEAARTLIMFSGVTVIPDIPENYKKNPEILEFYASEKMPWRESKTISGVIGEHITMARQAADGTWLIGAATDEKPRKLDIPLSFLGKGNYEALIIEDSKDSDYRTHKEGYVSKKIRVTSTNKIQVQLAPGGGACILLKKIK